MSKDTIMKRLKNKTVRRQVEILRQFKFGLSDTIDLRISQYLDIQGIRSVCLTLGPYRNLTTLTASVLFLHPSCQVLNHAGGRIFGNRKVDFLWDYNKDTFDRFIQFAVKISGTGQRGYVGGSITYSHAFSQKHEMSKIFKSTGLMMTKKQIKCLFWKESLRTSNMIRGRQVDLASFFRQDDRLRFLMPIRHPLDCAASNLKTHHIHLFQGLQNPFSMSETVRAVLDEIFWFANLKKEFPHRFFYFFEHQLSRTMLIDLAEFMQIDKDEDWISNALSAMKIKSDYQHDSKTIQFYKDYVTDNGSNFPELSEGLMSFIS